jgi:uncharacterized protein
MKKLSRNYRILIPVFILCFVLSGFSQDKVLLKKVEGTWSGTLKVQAMELTLVFNFKVNAHDSLIVTIDSPDQGAKDIPTSHVVVTNDSLIVKSKALKGTFRGSFNSDFTVSTGSWRQSGMTFPIEIKHSEKKFERNRPQEPKPPFPYKESEVVFLNPDAGNSLSGTLTMPDKKSIFPAVILITGSGPQNRNEELLGHKPFLVLADYLTKHGLAVLRYDDRGTGKSNGDFKTATTKDFATDVSAAVDFLKSQEGIDTSHIGLIGHSEGGIIAPMIASDRKDIAFVVLMAGPGLNGEQILQLQSALIAKADSASDKEIARAKKLNSDVYTILKKNSDNTIASEKIRNVIHSYNKKLAPGDKENLLSDKEIEIQLQSLTSPWFRNFLTLDPTVYLSKVTCPLFALNGSLDLQVPSKENLDAIEKAMIFGGNSHYTIEEIQGVNHLFQTATTGAPSEYSKIEETISPLVLEKITDWILKNTK